MALSTGADNNSAEKAPSLDGKQKQQQRYVSKLKRLSKELAALPSSSTEEQKNELPAKGKSPQIAVDESALQHETNIKQLKREKQIRSYQKLKNLINKLAPESPNSMSPQKSIQTTTTKCVTPDSIGHEASSSTVKKLKSTETSSDNKNSFNVQALLRCCGEMNMEDMFSADDDIDQLIDLKTLDDTTLGDWSLEDISSIRTGQTEREMDTINTTFNSEQGDFFRGEPCEI